MSTNGIGKRIDRLEQELGGVLVEEQPNPERDARFLEAAAEISRTMAPEHIRRINALVEDGLHSDPCPDPGAQRLLDRAIRMCDWAADQQTPAWSLALPPAVAEIVMQEPKEVRWHTCPDCQLSMPWARRVTLNNSTMIFETEGFYFPGGCPDCGSLKILVPRMPTSFEPGGINDWSKRRTA